MIKIKLHDIVATLTSTKTDGLKWTCEERPHLAEMLNSVSSRRPFTFEKHPEYSVARYIVDKYKDKGAEIIYNSRDDEPEEPYSEGMFD